MVRDLYSWYFSGENLFDKLFNYQNLKSGIFFNFICIDSFTFENDTFNTSLSSFSRNYKSDGYFYISTTNPDTEHFKVSNTFEAGSLNAEVDKNIEIVKYTQSFLWDTNYKWCIHLDNDLDCFFLWVDKSQVNLVDKTFLIPNSSFYKEANSELFLEIVINRLSYKNDFDFPEWKKVVLKNNLILFP